MVDITPYNTLRIKVGADQLIDLTDFSQLPTLINKGVFQKPHLFLGHGANILFTKDIPGTVIRITAGGFKVISETDTDIIIEASAGQDWHELVMAMAEANWSGMENMAFIPGTVGAAAVGNIAAYGQNQENILVDLDAVDVTTGVTEKFTNSDCKFTYRESIFKKNEYKNYLVTSVRYRLSKNPKLETSYKASRHASLLPELEQIAHPPYSVKDVAQAVINLRTRKLPDWTKIGTAGSFFKNPVVKRDIAQELKKKIPDLQMYPAEKLSYIDPSQADQYVKLPAGMLLEELGWRGKRMGDVGTSPQHSLVLLNYGHATGQQVFEFAQRMRHDVSTAFGISLEYEVVIL